MGGDWAGDRGCCVNGVSSEFRQVKVQLPASVIKIVEAAGANDEANGGFPHAMALIVGALPWLAVALFKAVERDQYDQFAQQLKENLQFAWSIAGADNPETAFDQALARAQASAADTGPS